MTCIISINSGTGQDRTSLKWWYRPRDRDKMALSYLIKRESVGTPIFTECRKIINCFVIISDYDKTIHLSDKLLLSACGESGDTTQFAEFIAKNVQVTIRGAR